MPRLAQVSFSSVDIAQSLRFHTQAFGFAAAGSRVFWGKYLAQLQSLGEDATCTIAWMVGRQELVQVEFFHHSDPVQRLLPPDWQPSDLGWCRWGVLVPDLDAVLERLRRTQTEPIAPGLIVHGLRRVCVRDPFTRMVIEIIQDGDAAPGGSRSATFDLAPALCYAAASVADLAAARLIFSDVLGLAEAAPTAVHPPGIEALWGLADADVEVAVFRAGDAFVELVQHHRPAPRQPPSDRRVSDQGFLHAAFAVRSPQHFTAILDRAAAIGLTPSVPPLNRPVAEVYLNAGDGLSIELLLIPPEYEQDYGFLPLERFPTPRNTR